MTTGKFIPIVTGEGLSIQHPINGRLRVVDQHFQNDNGAWPWWGISDFTAAWYIQTGQQGVLSKRLDAYASKGRTIVRTFGNLNWPWFGISIDWRSPGYWDALEQVRKMANARGMYMHLTCFGATVV